MSKTLLSILFATLVSMLVSSCGFRLKGDYQLPPSLLTLDLQSPDTHNELSRLVRNQLTRYQVDIANDADLPVLRLNKDTLERGTLSLFSSGQVAEYELIYNVSYLLIVPDREPQSFQITIRRDYLDDPQSAQAKSRERAQLLREIRSEAAQRIVYQLSQLQTL